jgi:hypothetical protein
MNTEPTAPDDNGGPEVATTGELAASRCRGNDPACPCQDGDLCHYVDDPITGTKAMPAPDDLARTLADEMGKHRPTATQFCAGCDWTPARIPGWREMDEGELHRAHLAEVLASVVSRRDTDLRTRIEDAFTAGWEARAVYRDPSVDLLVYERDLCARALVGDTREDAPTCTIPGCGHKWHAVAAADSRVPADTDTGRGQ